MDRPGVNQPFIDANVILLCGINSPTLFNGDAQAKQIVVEVFDDDFISCMENKNNIQTLRPQMVKSA